MTEAESEQPQYAVGDQVYLPNRLDPGHVAYQMACDVAREPGTLVSLRDGWAMVDRGAWGQFGCPVEDLRPVTEEEGQG